MRCTVRVSIARHLPSTCATTAHVIPHHGREKTWRAAGLTADWTLVHPALCRQRIRRKHVGTLSGNERRLRIGGLPWARFAQWRVVRGLAGRHLRSPQHHSVRSWPPPSGVTPRQQPASIITIGNSYSALFPTAQRRLLSTDLAGRLRRNVGSECSAGLGLR